MTDAPGDRVSLGETAYRRLRADIISCRLAPGQRLTERGLAVETGLGVSPIREALTRLDHDGLVKTVPHPPLWTSTSRPGMAAEVASRGLGQLMLTLAGPRGRGRGGRCLLANAAHGRSASGR